MVAAALGVGADYLASLGGEKGELYILPILVFILGNFFGIIFHFELSHAVMRNDVCL